MKRFIIIENSNSAHEEGIVSLVKLLKLKGLYVVLLLGKINLARAMELKLNQIADEIHPLRRYSSIFNVLNFRRCDDVIIYNTISVRNSVFTFVTSHGRGRNIYYIRNANSWLKYSWHYTSIIDYFTRNISTYLKKGMLKKAKMILVENSRLKDYLISHSVMNVEVVPFKLYDEFLQAPRLSTKVNFVVPGIVDFKTKRIDMVVEAFLSLDMEVRKRVQLTLLGRTKGVTEENKCREWKQLLGLSFVYFSSFVPVHDFSKIMSECDAVLSALIVKHRCEHFSEVYGLTRGSGVDAHAISHGLPLIVNYDFNVDSEYEASTIKFKDAEELSLIISQLVNFPENLDKLKSAAAVNAQNYSLVSIFSNTNLLWNDL